MKIKILTAAILIIAALTFSHCTQDEILSQDFDVVLYQDITVLNTTDTLFSGDKILDAAAQNSDIEKYKDNIEDMTLTKITYFLTAFNDSIDQELIEGGIDVADTNGNNRVNLTSMSHVGLAALLNNETQLSLSQAGSDLITDRVKNAPHALKVFYSGRVNKRPIDFTIRIRYYLKMKAKIL